MKGDGFTVSRLGDYRNCCKSQGTSVCVATGYGLDDRMIGVRFRSEAGNFSLRHRVQTTPIQWVPGALSLGVKRPGREADHSPPPRAEVKVCVELYLHSPTTPSWRGAQLKYRDILPLLYLPYIDEPR